jgi:hypothetical protein
MLTSTLSFVVAGHSASKTRVERACVPAIHDLLVVRKTWMPGTRPGMTAEAGGS